MALLNHYSSKHKEHPLREKKDRFWTCAECKASHLVASTKYVCAECHFSLCSKCFEASKIEITPPAPKPPEVNKFKDTLINNNIDETSKRKRNFVDELENPNDYQLVKDNYSGDKVRIFINHKGKKFILPELVATELTINQLKVKINQLLRLPVVSLHRGEQEFENSKHLYDYSFADDDEIIVNKGLIKEPKIEEIAKDDSINLSGGCEINRREYHTLQELQDDLQKCGLESSNLILGIDYTKSNLIQGKYTFFGQSLHSLDAIGRNGSRIQNPYQRVMFLLSKTLHHLDDDNLIPCYGFGDITTTDKSVFPFWENEEPSQGIEEVLRRYNQITPRVTLSGPTSFGPIIRKAINIVRSLKQYHILIIIADGEVQRVKDTASAIIEASHYPLSIIIVGVGDGPFTQLEEFDNQLTARLFDNLKFVNFHEITSRVGNNYEDLEAEFVKKALEEIPAQFRSILKLHLLDM